MVMSENEGHLAYAEDPKGVNVFLTQFVSEKV